MGTNDSYPAPKNRRRKQPTQPKRAAAKRKVTPLPYKSTTPAPGPDFSGDRQAYEESIFRSADMFNVFRFNAGGGSDSATVKTFTEAVCVAFAEPRALIYAVNSFTMDSFCVGRKEWNHYARIWLEMHPPKPASPSGRSRSLGK